jgi:hypothetical protein
VGIVACSAPHSLAAAALTFTQRQLFYTASSLYESVQIEEKTVEGRKVLEKIEQTSKHPIATGFSLFLNDL